jgi:hypothetical protein
LPTAAKPDIVDAMRRQKHALTSSFGSLLLAGLLLRLAR